jgi:adenylate cyclase class 2
MMLEVEMKFPIVDQAALEGRLQALGARFNLSRVETDRYFNAPDRDFAVTDEALRIRQIEELSVLTYKGPKLDATTKTRTEIEVPLEVGGGGAAENMVGILKHLGYREVAVVRKARTLFHVAYQSFDVEICLDRVEDVGSYAEIEIQATPNQLDTARAAVLSLARELELQDSERRSYLELLLARKLEGEPHGT